MLDDSLSNIALLGRLSTYIIAHYIKSLYSLGYLGSSYSCGLLPPLLRFMPPRTWNSISGPLDIISSSNLLGYLDSSCSCGILPPLLLPLPPLLFPPPRDCIAGELDAALYIIGIAIDFENELTLLIGIAHAIL